MIDLTVLGFSAKSSTTIQSQEMRVSICQAFGQTSFAQFCVDSSSVNQARVAYLQRRGSPCRIDNSGNMSNVNNSRGSSGPLGSLRGALGNACRFINDTGNVRVFGSVRNLNNYCKTFGIVPKGSSGAIGTPRSFPGATGGKSCTNGWAHRSGKVVAHKLENKVVTKDDYNNSGGWSLWSSNTHTRTHTYAHTQTHTDVHHRVSHTRLAFGGVCFVPVFGVGVLASLCPCLCVPLCPSPVRLSFSLSLSPCVSLSPCHSLFVSVSLSACLSVSVSPFVCASSCLACPSLSVCQSLQESCIESCFLCVSLPSCLTVLQEEESNTPWAKRSGSGSNSVSKNWGL